MTSFLLGRNVLALRLPTALAGSATVFAVFWVGWVIFGRDKEGQATPWRGLAAGGVGAGLLAVSLSHTGFGRLAFRAPFVPLFLCLCLALLRVGWRRRRWWWLALAGVCAGLLPYTYIAARFTPLLFLLFGLSFLLPFRSVNKGEVRAVVPWVAVFVVVTGLVASPILVHYALHPDHFVMHSKMVSLFRSDRNLGEALAAFMENIWGHRYALYYRGAPGGSSKALLWPWEAVFFWLGVGVAMWRWKRVAAFRLLLLWRVVLILPSTLTVTHWPSYLRMQGAVPAFYLLVSVGVWEGFCFMRERLPPRVASPFAVFVGVVASCLVLVQGVNTYRSYFQRWEVKSELPRYLAVPWKELAQALNAQPSEPNTAYLIPT